MSLPSERFVLPASPGQERLWFLSRLDQEASRAYHVFSAFRLEGDLDPSQVRRVLQVLVDRHEALRTTFALISAGGGDRQICQTIAPTRPAEMRFEDLSSSLEAGGDKGLEPLIDEFREAPFDLERGPLLRACLVREAPARHVLLLALHHIVADGWSLGILYRDFATLHAALSNGRLADLPELPVQFADYAAWQKELVASPDYQRHLTYWLRALSGVPPLELPAQRSRPRRQGHHGRRLAIGLDAATVERLTGLARSEGASLFMVLLAAYQLALGRRAGQTDFAVGTPVAGRIRPELENVVGFFANTLAIRADLGGRPTFRQLLGRVRARCLEGFERQEVDFAHLVDRLGVDRSLNRPPVFQAFFALQNLPVEPQQLEGLRITPLRLPTSTTRFDVTMELHPASGGLEGWLEYDDRLFDEAEVERLLGAFEEILACALRNPDQSFEIEERARPEKRPPVGANGGERSTRRPPRTPAERRIAAIFSRVLRCEVDDAGASFFTLGGNSLRAVTLATELEREFNVTVPIEVIFESPSVRSLADGLESATDPMSSLPDGAGFDGSIDALWREEAGKSSQTYGQAMEA
jgi:acyl carrier protein